MGDIDESFAGKGYVKFGSSIYDAVSYVEFLPDGKIIVLSSYWNGSNTDIAFYGLNSDFTTNTSFGNNGILIYDRGGKFEWPALMSRQSSGKITVCGLANSIDYGKGLLARFNTDFSLDSTFGLNGYAINGFGKDSTAFYRDYALQDDDKIVCVGEYNEKDDGWHLAVRFTEDGELDTAFADNGVALNHFSVGNNFSTATAIQEDGKIIVVGLSGAAFPSSNYDQTIMRFNTNGTLDTSLNSKGFILSSVFANRSSAFYDVMIQPDGKIVTVGNTNLPGGGAALTLIRYSSNISDGIEEWVSNSSNMVYPNPTNGVVYFNNTIQPKEVEVYDSNGRLLQKEYGVSQLDLSSHPAGIYLLKMVSENTVSTTRVVVSR